MSVQTNRRKLCANVVTNLKVGIAATQTVLKEDLFITVNTFGQECPRPTFGRLPYKF